MQLYPTTAPARKIRQRQLALFLALGAFLPLAAGCGKPDTDLPRSSIDGEVQGDEAGAAALATETSGTPADSSPVPGEDNAAGEATNEAGATEADTSAEAEATSNPSAAAPDAADPALPPTGMLDGIEVGFTEAGYPYRGSPDAPLIIEEYSDYHCPFCGRFSTQTKPALLEAYAATGKARFVFREFPIAALHPNAVKVHLAARCVAEQGAEPYWRMHDALFARQADSSNAVDLDTFLSEQVAALELDMDAYTECTAAGRSEAEVQAGIDAAKALGFNGTPSFLFRVSQTGESYPFVGAQPLDEFRSWFDAILAGDPPPVEPTAEPPELPFWANEGLAPDPERPGINLAGDPYEGSPDARLTVVEFTDYQCPPCRDFALDAHPAVAEALVESGELRWVVKNLPLPEHPQAAIGAAAAECATDQNRFWEMHAALFENVERWSVDSPDAVLSDIAVEAGLDAQTFASCLAARQAMERVMDDQFEALGITQSTPTFVIIDGEQGSVLRGNQSAEDMIDVIRKLLEQLEG